MSKLYRVNMNIDVSKATPNGGFLMRQVPKEEDDRGFKERSGAEVFAFLAGAAINGANAKCGFQALKGFRKTVKNLNDAAAKGEYLANKTDIDIIKNSINGNPNWPNSDEIFEVLDSIMTAIDQAEIVEG